MEIEEQITQHQQLGCIVIEHQFIQSGPEPDGNDLGQRIPSLCCCQNFRTTGKPFSQPRIGSREQELCLRVDIHGSADEKRMEPIGHDDTIHFAQSGQRLDGAFIQSHR